MHLKHGILQGLISILIYKIIYVGCAQRFKNFNTEQENFWAGEFGRDYINRNKGAEFLASNINFFSKSLSNRGEKSTSSIMFLCCN